MKIIVISIIIILIIIFSIIFIKGDMPSSKNNNEKTEIASEAPVSNKKVEIKIKTYLYEEGGNLEIFIGGKEFFNNSIDMYSPHKPLMEYMVDPTMKGVHKIFARLKVGEKIFEKELEKEFKTNIGLFINPKYNEKGILQGFNIEEFDYEDKLILQ